MKKWGIMTASREFLLQLYQDGTSGEEVLVRLGFENIKMIENPLPDNNYTATFVAQHEAFTNKFYYVPVMNSYLDRERQQRIYHLNYIDTYNGRIKIEPKPLGGDDTENYQAYKGAIKH